MRFDTAGGDEVIEGVGKGKTDTAANQSISILPHFEDKAHVRGATVEFIERGVGSRSHLVCMWISRNDAGAEEPPGESLAMFMADDVPGGRRKGGEHVRVDVVDGLYTG